MSDSQGVAEKTPRDSREHWGRLKLLSFRFSFLLFVLFTFPYPHEAVPGYFALGWDVDAGVRRVVLALGKRLLPISADVVAKPRAASSDTTSDWLKLAACVLLATLGTALWSFAVRRREGSRSHPRLAALLDVLARYWLGIALIGYGVVKVIPVQFAPTDERELFLRVGGMPLGALLWTFMRMSQPYVVLAGVAEVIPGLMLCFRRTALLGAALAVPVVANVFILDSFYGVPVRLFSGALLATALGLLAPHGSRLFTFFLLRRPVPAPTEAFSFERPWMRRVAGVVTVLVPVAALVFLGSNALERREAFFARSMPAALYGVYDVESFVVNGVERPPLTTDASRWRRVVASRYGAYRVEYMDERQEGFRHPYDDATHHLVLASWDESSKGDFSLSWPEADLLAMQGEWKGQPTRIALRRIPTPDFLQPRHPLPWVSEDIDF